MDHFTTKPNSTNPTDLPKPPPLVPNNSIQNSSQLILPEKEITHTRRTDRLVLRVTERGGDIKSIELDALKDGAPLVTFTSECFLRDGTAQAIRSLIAESSETLSPEATKKLGVDLIALPPALWRQKISFSAAHPDEICSTKPAILPGLRELFKSDDVTKMIVAHEHSSLSGSTLLLARRTPYHARIDLVVSETSVSHDDATVRAFTIYSPCTARTKLEEIEAWQVGRLEALSATLLKEGPRALIHSLTSSADDTVEISPSAPLQMSMERKLATWEYTPQHATFVWDRKHDMYVTTHIGISHAIVVIRYEENTLFPPVWIRFKTLDNERGFSSSQRALIASLAEKLTSEDESVKQDAIRCILSPLRYLGIEYKNTVELSLDAPALFFLDSLLVEHSPIRYTFRDLVGEEVESAVGHLPHLSFVTREVSSKEKIRYELLGKKPFSILFDHNSPGGHVQDLFRTSNFLFCPDGSFHVELQNVLQGISRAYVKTDLYSRPQAFLDLCRALSNQGESGWIPVQQLLNEFPNEGTPEESLTQWDPGLSTIPPLHDTMGVAMYSAAAQLSTKLALLIKGIQFSAEVHPTRPGACTLILKSNDTYCAVHLFLSDGKIFDCAFCKKNYSKDSSPWQEIWRLKSSGIPIDSSATDSIIRTLAKYLTDRSWTHFPDCYDVPTQNGKFNPDLITLQKFFDGHSG
jgi:hypothetical protein